MTGIRYTRERLAEAASRCANVREVIAFFGTRPYDTLERYLVRRFALFGIDISHFTGSRTAERPDETALRAAVSGSASYAEVLRRLGMSDCGAGRRKLRRWISEGGLSTAHFLGQASRRGLPGPTPKREADDILVLRRGHRRTSAYLLRRALAEKGVPMRCAECGVGPEWRGKPMTLEVDHISGDWHDNRRENLRLLCPNCHTLTATWCRGRGRPRKAEFLHPPSADAVE